MSKIKLIKDPHGDSRHAPKDTTFAQFHQANINHVVDVQNVMVALAEKLEEQAEAHDYTKFSNEEDFWNDFWSDDFVNGKWYQMHVHKEKHHPLSYCHDDITLLDIVEMVVDCVCAGKARAGEIRPLEVNDEILRLALQNTVKMIDNMTEVVDPEPSGDLPNDELPWDFDTAPTDDEID